MTSSSHDPSQLHDLLPPQIWIEDLTDMGGSQGDIQQLWEDCLGLSREHMNLYLTSLSENHQTMWQALPA